jgi:hypothetical protein
MMTQNEIWLSQPQVQAEEKGLIAWKDYLINWFCMDLMLATELDSRPPSI